MVVEYSDDTECVVNDWRRAAQAKSTIKQWKMDASVKNHNNLVVAHFSHRDLLLFVVCVGVCECITPSLR